MRKRPFHKENIKLASFDIDGTLFHRGQLSEPVAAALRRLHESGVTMVLATGRHPAALPLAIRALGVFAFSVSSNGSLLFDMRRRRVLFSTHFEARLATNLLGYIEDKTGYWHAVTNENVILSEEAFAHWMRSEPQLLAGAASIEDDLGFTNAYRSATTLADEPLDGVLKIGCQFKTDETAGIVLRDALGRFDVEGVTTEGYDLEFTPRGVTKGLGLSKLEERLGITPQEVVVFGDSGNDLESMLRAGYAVAMENGSDDVKEIADCIAPPVTEDGIATAIHELFGV